MRHAFFIAAFLSVMVSAAPCAHADDDMLNVKKNATPAPAPASAAPAAAPAAPAGKADAAGAAAPPADSAGTGANEFDSPPPTNAAFMGEADPDKPPPLDEYNNIGTDMMIPTEAAATATEVVGSGISTAGGKLTYENLMKMYQQKKYDEVAKDLEPLAKGGHRGAQELMGIMYRYGQGVPKDPKKAYDYLAEAAAANRPLAQYHLGTMYFAGEGVQTDSIMALMWLQIAIVHYGEGPEKDAALHDRDNMYTHLTRREKDRALQMAREWLTKRGEAHLLDLEGL